MLKDKIAEPRVSQCLQLLFDMEKFSIDWDEPIQTFRIRSQYWEFPQGRQVDRVFTLSNSTLMPFFLILNKCMVDRSETLYQIGGDVLYRLLYTHFYNNQLIVRAVRLILF